MHENTQTLIWTCYVFVSQEKYDDDNENSSEKINNNNNTETTILATGGGGAQPQQIFHVSVEYEEPKVKPKLENLDINRKRRLAKEKGIELTQQQLLSQYVSQMKPISSTPKQMPTIIIDDKSQDHDVKTSIIDADEPAVKRGRVEEAKTSDQFDIFGLFVASEIRNIKNPSLQKKLKRKILECVMETSDQDTDQLS